MKFLKDKRLRTAYLSLGSNLGDQKKNIVQALTQLSQRAGIIRKKSPLYKTEPVGNKNQPWFLNQCVEISTKLPPLKFLKTCQKIEKSLGRERRKEKWGPRTMDIDILFYENRVSRSLRLTLPHPRLHKRRFVLRPFAQIAPNFRHPILKKTVKELLKECRDRSIVRKLGNTSTQKTRHTIQNRHFVGRA